MITTVAALMSAAASAIVTVESRVRRLVGRKTTDNRAQDACADARPRAAKVILYSMAGPAYGAL